MIFVEQFCKKKLLRNRNVEIAQGPNRPRTSGLFIFFIFYFLFSDNDPAKSNSLQVAVPFKCRWLVWVFGQWLVILVIRIKHNWLNDHSTHIFLSSELKHIQLWFFWSQITLCCSKYRIFDLFTMTRKLASSDHFNMKVFVILFK